MFDLTFFIEQVISQWGLYCYLLMCVSFAGNRKGKRLQLWLLGMTREPSVIQHCQWLVVNIGALCLHNTNQLTWMAAPSIVL